MKKATLLLLLALAFAGCKKHETSEKENGGKPPVEEPPVKYETVEIGGTEWMLYNLANPRQAEGGATFATKLPSECTGTRLESHGKLYQWGVNVAWNTLGESINGATPSGSWNTSTAPSDWTDQPCPKGYRLPTDKEIKNLYNTTTVSNGGGWSEDDYGYKIFTFNDDSSKSLEFPAVGYRDGAGKLYAAGTWGYYWSSVEHSSVSAYHLLFDQSGAGPQAGSNKELGHNIRCVKGTDDPDTDDSDNTDDTEGPDDPDNPGNANPNPVDPDEKIDPFSTIEIAGTEWMPLNLANPRQAPGGATFATKLPSECTGTRLESHGKLYQWGVNVAWSSMGESINGATPDGKWNTSEWPSDWTDQPCPKGYRLPILQEFQNLYNRSIISNGGGWSEDDYGYKIFIHKNDYSKRLEFPAVGCLKFSSGSLLVAGNEGDYWSSDANGSYRAYYLGFDSGGLNVYDSNKHYGHSVRCVKGNPDEESNPNPNPVDPDKKIDPFGTIEIAGTEWMPLNLANPRQAPGGATFATKLPSQCSGIRAESHGKFYQWGINVAWNTTGKEPTGATPDGEWIHYYTSYAFSWADHPCPKGYRLPILQEFQNLYNSSIIANGGGWSEDDYGYKIFIHENDYSKRLEFPAVGYRLTDGSLSSGVGAGGDYWSSVAYDAINAYHLYFNSGNVGVSNDYLQYGFSVRCVRQ